jgi:hypothetical protein
MEGPMSQIEVEVVTYPAHFASALVNGDIGGLTDQELVGLGVIYVELEQADYEIVDVAAT